MKNWIFGILLFSFGFVHAQIEKNEVVQKIYDEALAKGQCYEDLRYLCKKIGHRLSGSPSAQKAVHWGHERLKIMGADTVWLQEVMVPHWVRGTEVCKILYPNQKSFDLKISTLGGSVATPANGIKASVIEVKNFEELKALGDKVKGKIVFFNRPMDPKKIDTFSAYGGCVDQRSSGASEASRMGAVAVVVRSMTLRTDNHPHTGGTWYANDVTPIPAAAISTLHANKLSSELFKNPNLQIELKLTCRTESDVLSHNVIAEIKGSEKPEEIILVGGHLDSWDIGEGAHDDGAGCVQAMEVLRLFKVLNLRPKRTIRVVLFMNEENGMKGALKYEEEASAKKEKHVACIESDRGGFTPRGFKVEGGFRNEEILRQHEKTLSHFDLHKITEGGGGVDISPFRKHNILLIGYEPDSQRYFDFHHAETDVFENVNQRELELGAAAITSLVWLLSEYGAQYQLK